MKHIDKYTIISILSSFLLFSCSEGLEIKSGPMILSVDKDMRMTVGLTGNDAPLTEKSQTEYIELEEGTVSDFKLKHRDIRVAGDTLKNFVRTSRQPMWLCLAHRCIISVSPHNSKP